MHICMKGDYGAQGPNGYDGRPGDPVSESIE